MESMATGLAVELHTRTGGQAYAFWEYLRVSMGDLSQSGNFIVRLTYNDVK